MKLNDYYCYSCRYDRLNVQIKLSKITAIDYEFTTFYDFSFSNKKRRNTYKYRILSMYVILKCAY